MIIDLKGRKAIVTGSTAGIGRAVAEGLARAGAAVVITGRRRERLEQAVQEMSRTFPACDISGHVADLSNREGAEAIFALVPQADVLINNLGTATRRPFFEITDENWLDMFQTNVMSGVRMSRHYMPDMVKQGWGRIVFISSESALNIPKEMIDYGMTKTAQLAISRGLAELAAGTGVTVNAVLPGPTRSERVGERIAANAHASGITQNEEEQEFLKAERPTTLIGRFMTVDEVANMVVYACSEQASATTGAALRVDGGVVRTIA